MNNSILENRKTYIDKLKDTSLNESTQIVLMAEMFGVCPGGRLSIAKAMRSLGIKQRHVDYIRDNIESGEIDNKTSSERIVNEVFESWFDKPLFAENIQRWSKQKWKRKK